MKTKGSAPVEILRRFDIFSGCDDRLLKKLSNLGTPVRIETGGALTKEGKQGREFYLIVEGDADVRHEGATIATLAAGGFFGEMALIDGLPRSADVVATSPMELLVFDPREFASLLNDYPSVSKRILRTMTLRLRAAQGER
jgi:CRP-like cAMP-binding protein